MIALSRSAASKLSKTKIKEICRLKNKYWPHSISSQIHWWQKNTKKNDICLLLKNKRILLGFLRLRHRKIKLGAVTKKAICVTEVCIDPSWRGKGHGSKLMREATRIIKNHPNSFGYLVCEKKSSDFYKTCAWQKLEKKIFVIKKNQKKPLKNNTVCMTANKTLYLSEPITLFGNTF